MRNLGHEGKGRLYPPIACRFLSPHEFAVVSKDHARIGMAHFECKPRRVLSEWSPEPNVLLDRLPLNYDDTTLRTIEQIDVLWLHRRSIVRAFEVEHTTSVYSGILRMADLLALQPNMDIKLHIVAPVGKREKVFSEIRRPVFPFWRKVHSRRVMDEATTGYRRKYCQVA